MEITITINDKEYRFRVSAATTYIFKQEFGKDLLKEFQSKNADDVEMVEMLSELAYIANRQAKDTTLNYTDWLDQFSLMELYQQILPPLAELWKDSNKTSVNLKKH